MSVTTKSLPTASNVTDAERVPTDALNVMGAAMAAATSVFGVAVAWAPEYVLPLWGTYVGPANAFIDMDVNVSVTAEAE